MNAVEIENLRFSYGSRVILDGVSFAVQSGETFCIAGLSGSGKSTLCNIIAGIIPNVVRGELSGGVRLLGGDISGAPLYEISLQAGLVFQDSDNQLVCTTVEDELAFGLENLCVDPLEIRRRVDSAMADFGLSEYALRNPAELSGGYRKILAIASIVIMNPPILILDEPMTGLDRDNREVVLRAINALRGAGRTIIIVEHDLSLVEYADRWLIIENGRVAALDTPTALLAEPDRLRGMGLLVADS